MDWKRGFTVIIIIAITVFAVFVVLRLNDVGLYSDSDIERLKKEAYNEGYKEGNVNKYEAGLGKNESPDYKQGYVDGREMGYGAGYNAGEQKGLVTAVNAERRIRGEDPLAEKGVYVYEDSKTRVYHRKGCEKCGKNPTKIDVYQAIKFTDPCPFCDPPS